MFKKFPAIFFVLILFASPLFAQEATPMVAADIDVFIDTFSHDSPEEMEKAAAKHANIDEAHMKDVVMKLAAIYSLQELGHTGQKLIDEANKLNVAVTLDDLALYQTKAAVLNPIIKKIVQPPTQ
jgi:hypothetical protein